MATRYQVTMIDRRIKTFEALIEAISPEQAANYALKLDPESPWISDDISRLIDFITVDEFSEYAVEEVSEYGEPAR